MDKISTELHAAMRDAHMAEGARQAVFCLPSSFIGFAGHFPGRPIVPAVVQIQMGCVVLAAGEDLPLRHPLRVDNAKFTWPIGPEELIRVCASPAPPAYGSDRWKVFVHVGEKKAAEFTLTLKENP